MTTTPLPSYGIWTTDMEGKRVMGFTPEQFLSVWQARADLEAENQRLLDTIDAIYIYANDTLSGRTDGPDDREWQRAAVVEIRNRARKHATVDSAVFARADLEVENKRLREALEAILDEQNDNEGYAKPATYDAARAALENEHD